jgi:hypothetical protein
MAVFFAFLRALIAGHESFVPLGLITGPTEIIPQSLHTFEAGQDIPKL